MICKTSVNFEKAILKIHDKTLRGRIEKIIVKINSCKSIHEVSNLIPIVGAPGYFRIRLSDYRIGIFVEDNTVLFCFFGKRDESTYKKFPG